MKEQDLIDLGFEVNHDDSDEQYPYYYYTYKLGFGSCLISSSSDDDDKWWVEFFEDDTIRFTNKKDLRTLINLLNENKRI